MVKLSFQVHGKAADVIMMQSQAFVRDVFRVYMGYARRRTANAMLHSFRNSKREQADGKMRKSYHFLHDPVLIEPR